MGRGPKWSRDQLGRTAWTPNGGPVVRRHSGDEKHQVVAFQVPKPANFSATIFLRSFKWFFIRIGTQPQNGPQKPAQNHSENTSMKASYPTSDSQFLFELRMILFLHFCPKSSLHMVFFFCSLLVHFGMKSSYFWAVRNFDQFHEDTRKNPHDHIMTFFTEFLQREPFYTYSGAFTPKVPLFFLKKKKKKESQFYATPGTWKIFEKFSHWRYGWIWKSWCRDVLPDLGDGELPKMIASPLYMQSREDRESSRKPIAPEKPAALLQERGASAKRTQADLRKTLDVKFVSGSKCTEETCCIVFIGKRRTGKPIQEFCFETRWLVKFGKISCWRQ